MYHLAETLGEDTEKWELVGLLHDLDYDQVQSDMAQHGIVASQLLHDKLPDDARYAIQSHDHRTGVQPMSTMDKALIIADSLANIIEDVTHELTMERLDVQIENVARDRPWLKDNLSKSHEIGISRLDLFALVIRIHNKMMRWVRICPQCLSTRIRAHVHGVWLYSPQRYQCLNCDYIGMNFVEVSLEDLERLKTGSED